MSRPPASSILKMNSTEEEATISQADALQKFRLEVKDIVSNEKIEDENYMLSWLEARGYDIPASVVMLKKSLEWRKQMGADTILDNFKPPDVLEKYYTGGVCGFDKEGRPVLVDPWGDLDAKGLLRSAKKSDIMKYECQTMEQLTKVFDEQSKKVAKPIHQFVLIYDLEHLGMKNLWKPGIDLSNEITAQLENNYPGRLKVTYVVNAPKLFPILFNMIKTFMSDATISSVQVLGADWKDTLLNVIDADQLPVKYGGTMTDPDGDGACKSMILYGGTIPQSLYIGLAHENMNRSLLETSVKSHSSLNLPFEVKEPNSVMSWEFRTNKYDIEFGIFHKKSDSEEEKDMESIIPKQRVNSHMVPETGAVTCQEPGSYVVKFDNSYSRMRSKKLYYSVDITAPEA